MCRYNIDESSEKRSIDDAEFIDKNSRSVLAKTKGNLGSEKFAEIHRKGTGNNLTLRNLKYSGANELIGDGDREANSARVSSHKNFRDIINGIYLKPTKGGGSGAQNMTGPPNGSANFYQNNNIVVQSKPSQTSTPNLNLMHTGVTNKP